MGEAKTAFEDLLVQINERMHRSMQSFKRAAIGRSEHTDVTIAQLYYVEALFRLKRPTLSELSVELGLSKASVSVAMHKLIHKGLVKAEQSGDDLRVYYLSLTAQGKKLIEAEKKALQDFSQGVRKALTDKEIQTLEEAFTKILAMDRE
jgi:DNA-binding MarR family transcriptional regulator